MKPNTYKKGATHQQSSETILKAVHNISVYQIELTECVCSKADYWGFLVLIHIFLNDVNSTMGCYLTPSDKSYWEVQQ